MRLNNSDIKKFQRLYENYFGTEISDDEAREELLLLVRQLEIIYRPLSIEELDKALKLNYGKAAQL